MSMPCTSSKPCNCEKGCKCEDGYECCTQKGNEGRVGLCVDKRCACNRTTGFPDKSSRNDSTPTGSKIVEKFSTYEGYSGEQCDCTDWKNALFVLVILVFILVGVIIGMKRSSE